MAKYKFNPHKRVLILKNQMNLPMKQGNKNIMVNQTITQEFGLEGTLLLKQNMENDVKASLTAIENAEIELTRKKESNRHLSKEYKKFTKAIVSVKLPEVKEKEVKVEEKTDESA